MTGRYGGTAPSNGVTELSTDECWAVLEETNLGRIALDGGEYIDIFPVNFTVRDRVLYFRSAPGSKLVELTRNPRVTFETDGRRDGTRWSVVVKGVAARLDVDSEIQASGVHALSSFSPTKKWNYVRITPLVVTGRRFESDR